LSPGEKETRKKNETERMGTNRETRWKRGKDTWALTWEEEDE
jgi:hypothetical protein